MLRAHVVLVAALVAAAAAYSLLAPAQALTFTTSAAHSPDDATCFIETLLKNQSVSATYYAWSWTLDSITCRVVAPDGELVYNNDAGDYDGHIEFQARLDGDYQFCFRSEPSESRVTFEINTQLYPELRELVQTEQVEPLQTSLVAVARALQAAKQDTRRLMSRDAKAWQVSLSNRRWVQAWTSVEVALLVAMVAWQMWRLRRMFEAKRVML